MLSDRAFELYKSYLKSDSDSSKSNVYILLSLLLQKYHSHMEDEGKVNSSSPYGYDDDEDEENTAPAKKPTTTSPLKPDIRVVQAICALVVDVVAKELRTDEHEDQSLSHPRQYGLCHKPFGTMRMRAVEFLYETFRIFYSHDLHHIFLACDLYNRLLYYFGKYPFHNILH